MKNIIIDERVYKCPTSWQEVTYKQWIALREWKARNKGKEDVSTTELIKYWCLWLECDFDILAQCRNVDIEYIIAPCLEFASAYIDYKESDTLIINSEEQKITKKLSAYSLAQKLSAMNCVNKALKEHNDIYFSLIDVLAIYTMPVFKEDKSFDEEETLRQSKTLENCNIINLLSVGDFFLRSLMILKNENERRLTANPKETKWQRALKGYRYFKSSTQSTH